MNRIIMAAGLTLAMEGEGEVWEEVLRIALAQGDDRIATSYPRLETTGEPLNRKRCPE